jgi:hypothetical protein
LATQDSRSRPKTGMHQTTLRFGPELWAQLEEAAGEAGVSIAQYVREAAVARLALAAAREDLARERAAAPHPSFSGARDARATSERELDSAQALWQQSRLARARAQELRNQAERRRRERS